MFGPGNHPGPSRVALIGALNRLGRQAGDRDKDSLAMLFRFPIPDSVIEVELEDSLLKPRSGWSRGLYDSLWPQIQKGWDLPMLADVFKKLNIERLSISDTLRREVSRGLPCRKFYQVSIAGDSSVRIEYGTASEDSLCAYRMVWYFAWDGQRLRLIRQVVAG